MSLEFAAAALNIPTSDVGPRGGKPLAPQYIPEAREANLNVEELPNGGHSLHRFKKNTNVAVRGAMTEQSWHRMAAYMILAGRTNVEIAHAADKTPQAVTNVRSQRWFQQLLATLANETGEDITGLLQSECASSIEKLVQLRDGADSERVQLAAALALVEHANGKPTQKIISDVTTRHKSAQEEMADIQQQLQAIKDRQYKQPVNLNSES